MRGGKYTLYEGGTRVPFIAYWRGHIPVGVSSALISQTDMLASLAMLAGVPLPQGQRFDSEDVLPALMGRSEHGRDILIEADVFQRNAIREGRWKLLDLDRPGRPPLPPGKNREFYDLLTDPAETTDVAAQNPDVVKELMDKLEQIRQEG